MNLKKMEGAARKRQEEEAAAVEQKNAAMSSAEAEQRSILEMRAAEYLAKTTGASLENLEDAISVSGWDAWHCLVEISIPEHATIQASLQRDESGMGWGSQDRRRWRIRNPYGNDKYCKDLGDALAIAACLWAEAEEAEERAAQVEAGREAVREQRNLDRIERGLHYVGIFEDHPFLKPIFDLLVAYVEDKEVFEADLDAAEEFAASMDEQYAQKLEKVKYAAQAAEDAKRQLQHNLWAEQDARREVEGKQREW